MEPEGTVKKQTKRMHQLTSQDDFEKTCLKTSFCFIGFLDSVSFYLKLFFQCVFSSQKKKMKYSNRN